MIKNKLVAIAIVAVLALGGLIGYKAYEQAHPQTGGAASTFGSLFVVPNSGQGDSYILAFGTSIYGSATKLIDTAGNWLGAINSTSSAHVGGFVEGGTVTPVSTSTTVTGAQICSVSAFQFTGTTANITLTLPTAASTTAANCLTTDGDILTLELLQNSTNTVAVATSTGDTILKAFNASSSLTLASTSPVSAVLKVLRVNSSSYTYWLYPAF